MKNQIIKTSAIVLLTLASSAPLTVRADGPTSRPSNRPDRMDRADRPDRADHPMRPWRQADKRGPVSAEQWAQILTFMREHSPRRTAELENLAVPGEVKSDFIKQLIAAQYDYVMSLQAEDPKLYDLQVKKIETQDAIYGMLRDMSQSGMDADEKKDFRVLVTTLVDVNLGERERRIEKARDALARAQSSLEADRKNKESLINDRVEQLKKEGARPFKMDGPTAPATRGPHHADDQATTEARGIDLQTKID
ncbi:hypothetical protein BH10PLA1_BH10PLA1_11660 [soil metagenome]